MKRVLHTYIPSLLFILTILLTTACSTTKRLAEGDVLYTGVKKMTIEATDGQARLIAESDCEYTV